MPRNLTVYTKAARAGILTLIAEQPENEPLPSLRELGDQFDLHPSTIFRVLHDLETEGIVWQGPSRRFFAASAQSHTLRGAPVCFIGRKIQDWSQLYQELLEGVAEICTANGSPLILHSAASLVEVPVELEPALFASPEKQKQELAKLVSTIPRGCAGFLLDHLWSDAALSSVSFPSGQRLQLLLGTGKHTKVISPNYDIGAKMIAEYMEAKGFAKVYLVIPDERERLFKKCMDQMRKTLAPQKVESVSYFDEAALRKIAAKADEYCCMVCPEDNMSVALAEMMAEYSPAGNDHIEVVAIQGTGVVTSPHTRLRYDYRRLGRAAASNILHGTAIKPMSPRLITCVEDEDA